MGDYRTAVIAGGDGSLGIAFNVAEGRDVALGYIPAGFGNATAHLLRSRAARRTWRRSLPPGRRGPST